MSAYVKKKSHSLARMTLLRACLKFISIWKSVVCGSGEGKISAFSELNKLIFPKSGSQNIGFQPIEI